MYRLKHIIDRIIADWNSILLCLISTWLGLLFLNRVHYLLSVILLLFTAAKATGLIINHTKLRRIGLIGLNIFWALMTYVLLAGRHPVVVIPYQFPLLVLAIGTGISLRARFDE
ncbi:hypothetical protein SAMN04488102_101372 [Alkalibacterium subtropicum]|uniref:Uncharacterized protein n=1 Tax=Alkalibacterium subtropicum TaxID=753702 RepID=A0A1I1EV68_9LACT|nr:hypothetical protein [Alkalibacterium subtropicum]SFB91004.1 hypothetical protein SAMN04488102_101372 [Alkalibacterium subtropicum]